MQKKWIVANWKMNGNLKLVQDYLETFKDTQLPHQLIVCPPSPYLCSFKNQNDFLLGGQDCHEYNSGAFTGNVSAPMLKELHCTYVLLGHSERRMYEKESSELVYQKAQAAQSAGLTPIICMGENEHDYAHGKTEEILAKFLETLQSLDRSNLMIAYEPLWAVGSGRIPDLEVINAVHQYIHTILPGIDVLYGGSVNKDNIQSILNLPYVQGVLVGGACLDAISFHNMCSL
jgi:triosephosphate isomerase